MSDTTPLKNTSTDDAKAPTTETTTAGGPNYPVVAIELSVMLAAGTGLAFAALYFDSKKITYESKILGLKAHDLQWLYLALVVLGRAIQMVNLVPTGFKKGLKGNIRSNPFFYETNDDKKTMVIFQSDGTNGMYNRSNRSVQHMVESFGAFLASIGPVGYLFPKQTFVVVSVFSVGRILHQKGYSWKFGGHAAGFALSTLAILTLEGLALLAFLKAEEIIA